VTSMNRDETTHKRSVLRQPLFQFLVLGLILFGLYVVFGEKQEAESKEIVISTQQIELLASMWEKQWRRPPTPQELNGLVQSFIREEVLYREALAMGLDRDDMVVRRRLAQKIEFLAQDLATQGEPGDAELRTELLAASRVYVVPDGPLHRLPFEALVLGLLGGAMGCLLVLPLHGVDTGTTNFQTFTEVAFAFRMTPRVLITAVSFAILLGLVGGAWPAWRAARMEPIQALRRR